MSETLWTLLGIISGWLLCIISMWIGICIGTRWKVQQDIRILRPWKKVKKKHEVIAAQAGAVKSNED